MMDGWLTLELAILLMYAGVIPSFANVYLLYEYRHQPGVIWFLLSMITGGVWAFLYATFTLVPSPELTLALANVFWAVVPTAAVTLFLLAYEFVFRQTVSRRFAAFLFSPIMLLFGLSWFNPGNLVFTDAYYVGPDGFLYFPNFDGVIKVLVTKVYGYLLVFLAAGMFVGEMIRTDGIRRRQAAYLLVIFSILVGSTMVKVAGLVPVYFDPTSVVYSFSGLLFSYSINRHGLLKFAPLAREQTFQEVSDAILVVDPNDVVVDLNRLGRQLFGSDAIGQSIEDVLSEHSEVAVDRSMALVELNLDECPRYFTMQTSSVEYGRGLPGEIVVLSEITALKERERDLDLLKQVLTRIFRHNIRNDINVIHGYLDMIKAQADDSVIELTEQISGRTTRLLNQAEKARSIEQVLMDDETVVRSLQVEVEQALSAYQTRNDLQLTASIADVAVEMHPRFGLVIQELVDNAITHHPPDEIPSVDLSTEVRVESVILTVTDTGTGIPQHEIEVLAAEEETNLKHSSGIGLWLVRWIVTHSNGELRVETTDRGARITIRLSRGVPTDAEGGHRTAFRSTI